MAGLGEQACRVLGRGDRQGVDDAAARQVCQVGQQPAQPVPGIRQVSTPSRSDSRPRAPRMVSTPSPSCSSMSWTTLELAVAVVASTGTDVRQLGDEVRNAAVIRAEVVAPVRNAVGLVNHQEPGAADEFRELVLPEGGVGEPFRGNQQHIHFVGGQLGADRVPFELVGGVDGHGADACPGGRGHLVPHECQQRRNDQRGSCAAAPAAAARPRSTRLTCPSRCAGPPGRGGRRRPAPRWPRYWPSWKLGFGVPHQLTQHLQRLALVPVSPAAGLAEAGRTAAFWLLAIGSVSQPPTDSRKVRARPMWTAASTPRPDGAPS